MMKMKLDIGYIFFPLVLMLCFVNASAQDFGAPEREYNAGNYDKAISLYQQIIRQKGTSPDILYNLGNAYCRKSEYGEAMICYSRARKLDPGNEEIDNNIAFLNNKIADSNRALQHGEMASVEPDEKTFFESIRDGIENDNTSDSWAIYAVSAFILFLVCVAVYFFTVNVIFRKIGFFGGIGLFILCVMFLIFSFMAKSEFNSRDSGVLMEYESTLLKEPDEKAAPACANLSRGTVVDIVDEDFGPDGKPTWYKVRLNSSYIGWVPAAGVKII